MIRNLLAVAALAGAGVAVAGTPASAGCYGTDQTVVACVDPTGATLWSDCVHLGTDPCTPVDVPGPVVSCRFGKLLDSWDPGFTLNVDGLDCLV